MAQSTAALKQLIVTNIQTWCNTVYSIAFDPAMLNVKKWKRFSKRVLDLATEAKDECSTLSVCVYGQYDAGYPCEVYVLDPTLPTTRTGKVIERTFIYDDESVDIIIYTDITDTNILAIIGHED
jgi:hypothetical protein